jgi:hypothetical protein
MTPEQKKIALIAVAGVAGIAVIWYLLKRSTVAGNQAISSAGVQPLTVPPPADITFNYPPLQTTGAVPGAAATTCTKLCETCDDNTSFAGTVLYRIPPSVLTNQMENLRSVGASYATGGARGTTPFAGGFESSLPGGGPSFAEAYGVL